MDKDSGLITSLIIGKWSAFIITLFGMTYFVVIIALIISGNFTLPPPLLVQNFAAVVDLVICPLIIILISTIQYIVPESKKVFINIGLIFSSLFTVVVYINRVCQLTIVRQSIAVGDTEGLKWFLPYEPRSIMFTLEIMGFSFFLSIALIFVALSLSDTTRKPIRITLIVYSILGLISFIGFLFNSLIVNVGFLAWGLVLYIGTWLIFNYLSQQYRLLK